MNNLLASSEVASVVQDVDAEANRLRLALRIFKTTRRTLAAIERADPLNPLCFTWQEKLDRARNDYLDAAMKSGMTRMAAEATMEEDLSSRAEP